MVWWIGASPLYRWTTPSGYQLNGDGQLGTTAWAVMSKERHALRLFATGDVVIIGGTGGDCGAVGLS